MLKKKRKQLVELWTDRLEGVVKNTDNWLDIIAIRRILLTKSEMIRQMLSFSKWTLNKGYTFISKMIFDLEEKDQNKSVPKFDQSLKFMDLPQDSVTKTDSTRAEAQLETHFPFVTLQTNQSTI